MTTLPGLHPMPPTDSTLKPVDVPKSLTSQRTDDQQVREAFDDFVGQTFYQQLLAAMRKTVGQPAYFDGGRAEEVFRGQLDQILSERMSDATADQLTGPMFELFSLRTRVNDTPGRRIRRMDAKSTRHELETQLAELLAELSSTQDELLDVLAAKRDSMAAGDVHRMNQLQPREERLYSRLQACHERRGELLTEAAGEGLPSDTLGSLAEGLAAGKAGALPKRVKEAASRMRLLQHHSLTNWVLAQRTMLHLSQMLEIIATGGRLQPTYGKGDPAMSSGALVDREA